MSVTALNREWAHLEARATVARWAATHPVLAGCGTPDDVLAAIRRTPDPALGALLHEDRQGCPHAARVVLQAMLGKVVLLAARDPYATAEEYAAQLWLVIRAYPIERRPARIAANLALDTRKAVRAEWDARQVAVDGTLFDELAGGETIGSGQDELRARRVLRAAYELGLIDGPTRDVLTSVYAEGLPGRVAAERHRTSHAALRKRCSGALRRLAAHRDALLEAA